MVLYNLSNLTAANNIADYGTAMNEISGGLVGVFILVCVFFILFMTFKKSGGDTKEVLLASSTISSIVGILLFAMGWIGQGILIYPIIGLIGSLLLVIFSQR